MILSLFPMSGIFSQNFDAAPVPFVPTNVVAFKMNLPITHLDINNYVASTRGIYAGRLATFKFYNRDYPWTAPNLFMRIRWDSDLDATNGVTWGNWFQDQNEDAYATVTKTYSTPGRYTLTFEIELYTSDGAQAYRRQKQYDITVVPTPTSVYKDSHGNQLFYWVGSDNVLNKPVLAVEGFDPDNSNTAAINYGIGFDLAELARAQGYDLFIVDWADGGADMTLNKDVFLGACQFLHTQLGGIEAAIQVVGISMGGVVAREGLAYAEDNSLAHPGQYIEHYVNTFISFDAPQQGGHMNTKLQAVLRDNGNSTQQITLQSMAAKQLLYEDVYDQTQTIHSDFYRNLRSLHNAEQPFGFTNGYPRRCLNFSISNGNRNADYPSLTTHDDLATLYEYANVNILSIVTLPPITHTNKISAQVRDLWPGSTFPDDLRTLSTQGFKDFLSVGPGGVFLTAGGGWIFRVNFNPGYTPTESALDLDGYLRSGDGTLAGGKSWFDDTLTQLTVHRHEELTAESKTKVMTWLNNSVRYPYLGRPSGLRATPSGGSSIQITFVDQSAFESGMKIERKTDGGAYVEIGSIGPNQAQYLDADASLQLFKTYYYRVRSYNGTRYSPYSDEVAVLLQPHLQSSTPAATSSNAQHKMVQTTSASGTTDLYMMYESAGNSFLTHYYTPSATWDPEKAIGNATTTGVLIRHPSLLLDSLGANPYVAYEKVELSTSTHSVLLDCYDRVSGTFYPLVTLAGFVGDTAIHATPVAAISKSKPGCPSFLVASWKNATSIGFGLGCYTGTSSPAGYSWSAIDFTGRFSIMNATNHSIAITMLGPATKPVPNFYLVWEETGAGGGIRLLHGSYNSSAWPPLASQVVWEQNQIIHVADNNTSDTHSRPSIALDASGKIHLAWQLRNGAGGNIQEQTRDVFTSDVVLSTISFSSCGSLSASSPSLSDFRYTSTRPDDMMLTWSASNGIVCTQLMHGAWSAPYIVAPAGNDPNIESTFDASDLNRTIAYVGSPISPYAIATMIIPSPQPPPKTFLLFPQNASTGVSPGTPLIWSCTFAASSYTFHIDDGAAYTRDYPGLAQTSFVVPGLAYSTPYHWRVQALNSNGAGAWSDTRTFKTQAPPLPPGSRNSITEDSVRSDKVIEGGPERSIPKRFLIGEGYPNPFNPQTKLSYELAGPGHVVIAVYDLAGREIARLVDEDQQAGYYDRVWDADNRSSGVYYARIVVTDQSGRELFVASRKLLLLK
jgi:hypothetical protein